MVALSERDSNRTLPCPGVSTRTTRDTPAPYLRRQGRTSTLNPCSVGESQMSTVSLTYSVWTLPETFRPTSTTVLTMVPRRLTDRCLHPQSRRRPVYHGSSRVSEPTETGSRDTPTRRNSRTTLRRRLRPPDPPYPYP